LSAYRILDHQRIHGERGAVLPEYLLLLSFLSLVLCSSISSVQFGAEQTFSSVSLQLSRSQFSPLLGPVGGGTESGHPDGHSYYEPEYDSELEESGLDRGTRPPLGGTIIGRPLR
jgi:Flp pilus assembly pilin Flp